MPHTKRPLLLAALALVAFAALFNPAAAGDTAAVGTMDPPKEDALLMPTDAEADPAATDAAAKEMDMAPDMDMEPAAEEDAELKPLGETLQADPEFSTLVALVTAAADESGATAEDLAAEGPFTLFAPVNEAFTKFLETSGLSVEEVLASPDLKEILSHHVVEGKYTAADVLAMELPAEVPTLDGHTIKIDKTTDGDVLIAGNKVVAPDIEASNGVIHGIDGVITETTPEPEE